MTILFDNNTPAALAHYLPGHDITRAAQLGWASYRNGDLLNAAEMADFTLLITCDQNLPYQQNMGGRKIALVILSTNHWPTVRSAAARIASTVDFVQRGQVIRVEVRIVTSETSNYKALW